MNVKRLARIALFRQHLVKVARAYCSNQVSLNAQQGRGFQAAEDGWPLTANPYKVRSKQRKWWHRGYQIGLTAIELGLIPSAPRSKRA